MRGVVGGGREGVSSRGNMHASGPGRAGQAAAAAPVIDRNTCALVGVGLEAQNPDQVAVPCRVDTVDHHSSIARMP